MSNQILNNEIKQVASGTHDVNVIITTGTADLQYSVNSKDFVSIPSASVSASTGFDVTLPDCRIKAVLTGDAVMHVTQVRR